MGLGLRTLGFFGISLSPGSSFPKTPSRQLVPVWGLKSINSTYFAQFGVLGALVLGLHSEVRAQGLGNRMSYSAGSSFPLASKSYVIGSLGPKALKYESWELVCFGAPLRVLGLRGLG